MKKTARRHRRPRVAILLKFHEADGVTGYPIVSTDQEQLELARRLRRLASTIVESPSLAERLAGLPDTLSR